MSAEVRFKMPDAWVTEWNVLFVIAPPVSKERTLDAANAILAEWDYPIKLNVYSFRENRKIEWVDPTVIAEESWPESGWSTTPVEGWVKVYRIDLENLTEEPNV